MEEEEQCGPAGQGAGDRLDPARTAGCLKSQIAVCLLKSPKSPVVSEVPEGVVLSSDAPCNWIQLLDRGRVALNHTLGTASPTRFTPPEV